MNDIFLVKKGVEIEKAFKLTITLTLPITKITYRSIVFNNENSDLKIKQFFKLPLKSSKILEPTIQHVL